MERMESDHLPLELYINDKEIIGPTAKADINECTETFIWKADCALQFI